MVGGLIRISCHEGVSSEHIIMCQECNYQTCTVSTLFLFLVLLLLLSMMSYLCNICTHAQQRFLTVTHAKWWSLHAGRNPKTSVFETSQDLFSICCLICCVALPSSGQLCSLTSVASERSGKFPDVSYQT